ncbi:MAG: agmatine deiminase family protein [Bermanella sp.]
MTRYFPAEWHPQYAIQLTWPHSKTDWDWVLNEIQSLYIELINTITEYENVILSVPNSECIDGIRTQLKTNHFKCEFYVIANDDTWARDHGPIGIYEDGKLAIQDFQFNGWGGKFDANQDNQITSYLFQQNAYYSHTYESHNFILEGGSIESDGNGALLTTRQCLMNTNRNASLNQDQIEVYLKDALGCDKILWLKHGDLIGDDTDAHVDTLARFAPNNQIIFQGCQDPEDDHYNDLNAMKEELSQLTNVNNKPYKLIELPWPDALYETQSNQRLPATYANFLFINGAVLLPVYGVKQDALAIKVMTDALPNHKVIPINCAVVVRQYGSLHCLTMQIPTSKQQGAL